MIPAVRAKDQDVGRPKGGLVQFSRKTIDVRKDRISTKSYRLQAQVLNFPKVRILWINSYFPNDPLTETFDDSDLLEVLSEIESIIDKTIFDDIVWNGDLNFDPSRRSGFCRMVKRFLNRVGLVSLWDSNDVDYTHVHTDFVSTAVLDHFIVTERLVPLVVKCQPIHRGDNLSRHSPILLQLNLGNIPSRQVKVSWLPKKPAWHKAPEEVIESYKSDLQSRLNCLTLPASLECMDPACKQTTHSEDRDDLVLDVLCAIVESSHTVIPLAGGRKASETPISDVKQDVPGWKAEVEPFREDAELWHSIWLSSGKPNKGVLHSLMAKTRNQYHYAVRRTKRSASLQRAKGLFEASLLGDMQLIQEMKRIKSGVKAAPTLPDTVAGANGEEEIVKKFREVYSALYTSGSSEQEMFQLKDKLQGMIIADKVNSVKEVQKITGSVVKQAADLMKTGKADVSGGFSSDAILNGPDVIFDQLAAVFKSWLVHGTVTPSLLACGFLPLLKSALKDPADPNSYRAIAGSSIVLKLFDKTVLLIWGHLLSSDSLQFGYKKKTSTTQCSWLVLEVVNHYLRQGSHPIITLMDCTKAFDMCKFSILFGRLIDKNVPAVVIRTLATVYEDQFAWVKWGSVRSDQFIMTTGTRQGSILSPALFLVYMDPLLKELRALGIGCHVAGVYMGAVGFCDDILLLAPTRDAMQRMLDTCESFAERNNLLFSTDPNPSKSKTKSIFVCGRKKGLAKPVPLSLYGKELPWVPSGTHLGQEIHESGTMDLDTRVKRANFIEQSTEIRETFSFASPVEVLQAVKVYASSWFGSMLWELGGDTVKQVFSAWNTCLKLAWNVPRQTHTYFADHLLGSGISHAKTDILAEYVGFFHSLRSSPSQEVRILVNMVGRNMQSCTGKNLSFIKKETGLDVWSSSSKQVRVALEKGTKLAVVPVQDQWRIPLLAKLLAERGEKYYLCENFDILTEQIESLCMS